MHANKPLNLWSAIILWSTLLIVALTKQWSSINPQILYGIIGIAAAATGNYMVETIQLCKPNKARTNNVN